jgi:hypothetical protein
MRYALRVSAHLPANLFWKKPVFRRVYSRLVTAFSALAALYTD